MIYFFLMALVFFIWSAGVAAVTTQTRSGILDNGVMFIAWLLGSAALFISFGVMMNLSKLC